MAATHEGSGLPYRGTGMSEEDAVPDTDPSDVSIFSKACAP